MKVATFAIIVLFALSAVALAVSPSAMLPEKIDELSDPGKPDSREGGETIATAWVIYSLPFTDTGNTSDNIHDYDEVCPYTGSLSKDVVYAFTPTEDLCVSASLCNSYYDTKIYIYDTAMNVIACNDDSYDCVNPPVSYTSWIPLAPLDAGMTYYFVVDGYGSVNGDYVFELTQVECPTPCDVCEGDADENEPDCYPDYEDVTNGGCNDDITPYSFGLIPTSATPFTMCGTSGVYSYYGSTYRDTDWFLIYPCGGTPITFNLVADFGAVLGLVQLNVPCDQVTSFYTYTSSLDPCANLTLTEYLPYGQFAVFVSTANWDPWPCGSVYTLTIDGYTEHCDPTAVENTSWGSIKALYR